MYYIYDTYDGDEELLGRYATMIQVKAAARQRDEDTDGEREPLLKQDKLVWQGDCATEMFCNIYQWSY